MEVRKWWILICFVVHARASIRPWQYTCDKYKRCVKTEVASRNDLEGGDVDGEVQGLGRCKLTCGEYATLWPRPREVTLGKSVTSFSLDNVDLVSTAAEGSPEVVSILQQNIDEQITWLRAKKDYEGPVESSGNLLRISVRLESGSTNGEKPQMSRFTDESYRLNIKADDENKILTADIAADNYFGARHALETLFQLVEYDAVANSYFVLDDVQISDRPEFRHRGITLDTSRNFMTVDVIKRIIDGLAQNKMNVFHWHIVDTHSFPVEHLREPIRRMSQIGAYGPDKIYTQQDIRDIVAHAHFRGVRVIPELDQPAHVGNGWQFPGADNFTVCVNKEPWYDYCVEPPCGQLNPFEPGVYDTLAKIYEEWYEMFKFDTFHMGADEIHFGCWNSSQLITETMKASNIETNKEGFIKIWSNFQHLSRSRLENAVDDPSKLEVLVWTSDLTSREFVDNLPREDYVVQIWSNSTNTADDQIRTLAEKGYSMVFSNFDVVYLDCGYGAWVGEGNNWCSPYKGWQKIYEYDLYQILRNHGVEVDDDVKALVLGAEVAMWSEQVDSEHVEGKIFPRLSALAERLWTNPSTGWYEAEDRILEQRRRSVHRGIRADALQPEWCRQNSGQCYWKTDNPMQ